MNHPAISSEELLTAADQIARREGFDHLSIRSVAQACGISVGCLYNYFPSKSDLLLALVERFWDQAMRSAGLGVVKPEPFPTWFRSLYRNLAGSLDAYTVGYLREMASLAAPDKQRGRRIESTYWQHMKHAIQAQLAADPDIPPSVWSTTLTPEAFAEFLFVTAMGSLRSGQKDIAILTELIERTLYR